MRWDELPQSDNVEDRRGDGGGLGGGSGGGFPMGGGGLGIGGIIVLGLIGWALGIDPRLLIGGAEDSHRRQSAHRRSSPSPAATARAAPARRPTRPGEFVAAVLGSTEVHLEGYLRQGRADLPRAATGDVLRRHALGVRRCAKRDGTVLLSDRPRGLSRHLVLPRPGAALPRLQRQGLRIRAGLCDRARGRPSRAEPARHSAEGAAGAARAWTSAESNQLQVRVELQADCFAGVWANHAEQKWKFLDPGDVDAALQTAAAIGDDMLQKRSQGYVVPDSFTHGTSEQRKRWFMTGFKEGTIKACNTFAATPSVVTHPPCPASTNRASSCRSRSRC